MVSVMRPISDPEDRSLPLRGPVSQEARCRQPSTHSRIMNLRQNLLALMFVVISTVQAVADEPPIQGPVDAACREQARSQVFTAPNPNHLSLWDLGSQIWHTCMATYHASGPNPGRQERRF